MSILICSHMDLDVAGERLLSDVTFHLEAGEKVGLIGANGAGKTSLLRAVMQEIPYHGGELDCRCAVGYLPQNPLPVLLEGSVWSVMLAQKQEVLDLRAELRYLELRMAQDAGEEILNKYGALTEAYEDLDGYALEAKARRILTGLGLFEDRERDCTRLSGGQKTRLALAKLLMNEPEMLILDEPTNHLDLEALEWLETYLVTYPEAVLVVSHDRYFLDKIAEKILCVGGGTAKMYKGNYSRFELARALEEKSLSREAERVNRKIASLEAYIRRFGAGIKARQARGREKQLEKIAPLAGPPKEKKLSMSFDNVVRAGDLVLKIEGLAVAYGQHQVFRNVELLLQRGDKVALLGKNGVGKTSLLRAVLGQIPYEGRIKLGANVTIAYYAQEHENVGTQETVIEELRYDSSLEDPEIRSHLALFGFRGEDVFKPVRNLSGGEKSRLALSKLFLTKCNLLLLDEPTNHLDMETREVLEEALREYGGAVLTVSHDRYFLDRVVGKVALLTPGELRFLEGDYSAYRQYILAEEEKIRAAKREKSENAQSGSRQEMEERKRLQRLQRKKEQVEALIQEKEEELAALQEEMALTGGDYVKAMELHERQTALQEELDEFLEEWLAYDG